MKLRTTLLVVAALAIFAAVFFFNRSSVIQAQSQAAGPAPSSCCSNLAPREIDFPYYSLKDGFESKLLLVSDSPNPIDLAIAIHNLYGQTLLDSETIQPQAKLTIDLASTIRKLGGDPTGSFAEGSVSVDFMGTIMPVVGQMSVTNPSRGLTHQVDMVENDPGRSDIPAILNGLWWGLGGGNDAQVMVSNTSVNPVIAEIYLEFQGARHEVHPMMFAPNETKVLDINQMLAALGVDPARAPSGGITITGLGQHPALVASGKITDPATGFSSTIDFPDPQVQLASSLHATGLPIGTPPQGSPFAGAGRFVPRVVMRNLLGTPQTVTVTVEYPHSSVSAGSPSATAALDPVAAEDGKHSPPTGQYVIPAFTVPGYTTEDFSLSSVMNQLPLPLPFCSIRIQYSGAPGSMIADVSSVNPATNFVVDSRAQNEDNGWAGSGANPWHIDANTDSVLFLTNMGDKPSPISFEVTANGIHYYLTNLTLNAHETRAIDMRALRDAQKPDFRGTRIPANASDGSVNWVRGALVPVEGRMMVINRHGHTANSYDCNPSHCPPSAVAFELTIPGGLLPGGGVQISVTLEKRDCNYNIYYTGWGPGECYWSSSNTEVATVDSSGWVTGVAGGVTYIDCYGFAPTYSCNPTGHCQEQSTRVGAPTAPVTVHVTAQVSITPASQTASISKANANGGKLGTITVEVAHGQIASGQSGTVEVEVYQKTGPTNDVTIPNGNQKVTLNDGGPQSQTYNVDVGPAPAPGTITITATISDPSSNVQIPAADATATTTMTITK